MSKDDGGPAFPGAEVEVRVTDFDSIEMMMPVIAPGMSLRDYFAAAALQEFMNFWLRQPPEGDKDNWQKAAGRYATNAYRVADAMLAARKAED